MNAPPPIRVLHLIHHLHTGGAERMVATLVPALNARPDLDVSAAVLDTPGALERCLTDSGVPLYRFRKSGGFRLFLLRDLYRLLRAQSITVLHMHDLSAGLWGRLAGWMAGTPVRMVTRHAVEGWHKPRKHRLLAAVLEPLTTGHTVVCSAGRAALIAQEGIRGERIKVILNGVDLSPFRLLRDRREARRGFNIPDDAFVVGAIGRCAPEKGGDVFVAAVRRLLDAIPTSLGVIAGDGPCRRAWESQAAACGCGSRIRFLGALPHEQIPVFMAALDVGLVASHAEACSMAIIEMMASGLPVVATDVGGNAEVLGEKCGLVVSPGDSWALADAVMDLYASPARRASMGICGKLRAENHFSLEAMVSRYAQYYHEMTNYIRDAI